MTAKLANAWSEFRNALKAYPQADLYLNGPCDVKELMLIQARLSFQLPDVLTELLLLNNGQNLDGPGLFKSLSGWDRYSRLFFLDAAKIAVAYDRLTRDQVLSKEFGTHEIPFAAAGTPQGYSEAFSINRDNDQVSLLWTEYANPFNPAEWQLRKFKRAESLISFIELQTRMYQ